MKYGILLEMLFDLLEKRTVTAQAFADKFEISVRTVYRYVDELSFVLPIQVMRGRNGGICISDSYKLPKGFMTKEEYESAIEALEVMYSQLPESRFLDAKRKLSSQLKSETRDLAHSGELGTILIDGGTWGDSALFSEKMRLFEECIKERIVLEIEYHSRGGEKTLRKIEPHVLVFKQNVWYAYSFCHLKREFRLFRLGRVHSAMKTDERFFKRPFEREDIPLNFWTDETQAIEARFEVADEAFADVQDWLGGENLYEANGKWQASVRLPDGEGLVLKILSMGAGVKVLYPESLKQRVKETAKAIAKQY
ncbi:MAG: YafY family transcriptional regulator [Clostridia bacterium]|nr:YafY family transcriptional regulator [Clostridia bacterium]